METLGTILKTIQDITTYCEKYNTWVQVYRNPKNEIELEATRLAKWLDRYCYLSDLHECTLSYIKDANGVPLSFMLDNLYLKYHTRNRNFNIYVKKMLKKIINYIETYGKWPEKTNNPKSDAEINGNEYSYWLEKVGYTPGKKIFDELKNEKGIYYYEILNSLALKYYTTYITKLKVLTYIGKLKTYCSSYNRWPRKVNNINTEEEKEASVLYNWLEESGYNSNTFKYIDYVDEYDIPIKTIIDNYYNIYNKKEVLGEEEILQNKDNKLESLIGYIILLSNVIYSDMEKYVHYIDCIKKLINELNIELNIGVIINYLILSYEEQIDLYYKKYIEYKDSNIDLANFYLKLYQYTLNVNKEKEKEEKRRK